MNRAAGFGGEGPTGPQRPPLRKVPAQTPSRQAGSTPSTAATASLAADGIGAPDRDRDLLPKPVVPGRRYDAPPRIVELMREGAQRALAASTEILERVERAALEEHDPLVSADPVLLEAFRRANRVMIAHWAESVARDPLQPVEPFVGPEIVGLVRDLVRRDLDARAVEPYRAGQNAAWQAWMEICFTLTDDPAELRELLRLSARSIFDYVDVTSAATVEWIIREREQLSRGTNAERLAAVTLLLEGSPIDPARTGRRLGYELAGKHLAAVVWSTAPDVRASALDEAVAALARAVGVRHPLVVVPSEGTRWAWFHGAEVPDSEDVARQLAALGEVRAAFGTPGTDLEGFRRSHREALAAQRLVSRLGSAARAVRYDEVRLAALLTSDSEAARSFVIETLGELANAPATLRETLRIYLREQSNATRTARALPAHRNTVLARVARAESLLPRPLAEHALEVACALEIAHWQDGPGR
ncbi:PucR family transcriptional regulator [Thermoleophilum album]|uniref:DNA-binding transcriptional regulator, PucR family n=1 Tax=Thermoleophilum album TaxID=29539 RepID=A0A1H6FMA0_THEAL|nr:helix-turn-helix domain-containing protein [Thermoleophilum album]SEH10945.1 DNA-binding transcriptional regulator, PucR family [Thermoleophilum album]